MSTAIIVTISTDKYSNKFRAAFSSYKHCVEYMKQHIDNIMGIKSDRIKTTNCNGSLCLIVNDEEFQYDFMRVNLSDPSDFEFVGTITDELVDYFNKNRGENYGTAS